MRPDFKRHFSRFFAANPGRLHFAAHSHHYWPDVTCDAQMECWEDAARLADLKWDKVFGEVLPAVSAGIAKILNLPTADSIVFAPNTHEFVLRLLSCFPTSRPTRILTTDSEFYSFRRQTQRLEEEGQIELTIIPAMPFDTFEERFAEAARGEFDMVFFSQVFFDSGFAVSRLSEIVGTVPNPATFIVIDGYHGFMAMPTDLSGIANRAFYLSGGYKYAMAGEGACLMHCPPGFGERPANTGWFAEMDSLAAEKSGKVDYAPGAERFFGATFDPCGLYRQRAVFEWLDRESVTVEEIHAHVHGLHQAFGLEGALIAPNDPRHGHFLTYVTPKADEIRLALQEKNILVDNRGDRLRFGFSVYHDSEDVEKLREAVSKLLT